MVCTHACCILDEFVAARTLFPRKAEKDEPEYCLATSDALLKRIVTMGASAGCYVITSISTDGEHDDISFVRFPRLEFPVYAELGRLLRLYGGDD